MAQFNLSDTADNSKVFLVKRSELEERFEPNFYSQENRVLLEKIRSKKHYRLRELASFSSETWNQKDFFKNTFPYIEISEINLSTGKVEEIKEVEIDNAPSRAKMIVRKNDIIVSTTRPTRGAISFFNDIDSIKIASTGFAVIRKVKEEVISRETLFNVLRMPFCLQQMGQRSSGGNYPAITQEELGNILIPFIDDNIQQQIIDLYQTAYTQKQQKEAQAKELLTSIDTYLLNELGITLPEKDTSLQSRIFTTMFSEVSGGRFESQYHTQYNKDVLKSIESSKYPIEIIKKHTQFIPGYAFSSDSYIEFSECYLITIKNISKNTIELENVTYLPNHFFEDYSKFQINRNDLLIAMTGATIGKVGIYESDDKALLNQRNGIIKSETLNTFYLMNLLNTEIYQSLILKNSVGGAQPNISETDITRIGIPLPPIEKQSEIANHIQVIRAQAKQLQEESKAVLEEAKREVEKMILG